MEDGDVVQIVSASHVSMNPRIWREADALCAAGFHVVVTCGWFSERHAEMDRRLARESRWDLNVAFDLRGTSLRDRVRGGWLRVQRAAAGRVERVVPSMRRHALGYGVGRLFKAAAAVGATLTIGHGEVAYDTLHRLARRGGLVGVDFDDWVSENQDPATNPRRIAYLREMERAAAGMASTVTTASHALAAALRESVQPRSAIETVYNSVPRIRYDDIHRAEGGLKLVWMSQTIGPTRGLELLFEALRRVTGFKVTLIGDLPERYRPWFDEQTRTCDRDRLAVVPPVYPGDLTRALAEHDVGCALEVPYCRNKDLTVSNKILHYLQCGLHVVASSTAGHREVLNQLPYGGEMFTPSDPSSFIEAVRTCIDNRDRNRSQRLSLARAANDRFEYRLQGEKVVNAVRAAIDGRRVQR